MSEYIRTTRECLVSELRPELLQAIQKYFHEHGEDDWQTQTLQCCETVSRKKTGMVASLLNNRLDTIIHTGMLLTSRSLVWVHHGDQSGTLLNAADLMKIGVRFHPSLFITDAGLEMIGYVGDSNARVRGYIAMGPEPVAEKFCEEVRQAIIKLNPPSKKKIFGWTID